MSLDVDLMGAHDWTPAPSVVASCRPADLVRGHVVLSDHSERTVDYVRQLPAAVLVWFTDGTFTRYSPDATLTVRVLP